MGNFDIDIAEMDIDIDDNGDNNDNNDNNYVAALLKDSYCCPVKLLERLIWVKAVVYQIVTSQLYSSEGPSTPSSIIRSIQSFG